MKTAGVIVLRVLAAALGGYAFASLAALLVARLMPWCCGWSRAEAVLTGGLLSFVFYLVAALWVFSVRSTAVVAVAALVSAGLGSAVWYGWLH